jgi:PKD repeat protein
VELLAAAVDSNASPVQGVPVAFTASAGRLSSSSAITDAAGEARTRLTTNRQTTITARARSKEVTTTVRVNPVPRISIKADPASPLVGQPTFFRVTTESEPNASRIHNVITDFGDRRSANLGALIGMTTVTHTYSSPCACTVKVTVVDGGGEETWQATVIIVRGLITVTVSGTPVEASVGQAVSLNATVNPSDTLIQRYEWNFDGKRAVDATTTSNQTAHVYLTPGTKIIRVTTTATDGTIGAGQLAIAVKP